MRKPEWLKVSLPTGETFANLKGLMRSLNLHTVCEEARCPNVAECWGGGTATVMLMGDVCSRHCGFCAVESGRPGALDPLEPRNVAAAIAQLSLTYVVLTSVNRDDLEDGGAAHFAETVRRIKSLDPGILVEVLIPDFQGREESVRLIVDSGGDVIAHNVEGVRRVSPKMRDRRASFDQSLEVLRMVKRMDPERWTKTSIQLGHGESEEEVVAAMRELRDAKVDVLTLGQYLQPSRRHLDVVEYVHPDTFKRLAQIGESMGFAHVAAGPLVRSSYRAGEFFLEAKIREERSRVEAGAQPRDSCSSASSSSPRRAGA
jgi:lipoic acid synthetase